MKSVVDFLSRQNGNKKKLQKMRRDWRRTDQGGGGPMSNLVVINPFKGSFSGAAMEAIIDLCILDQTFSYEKATIRFLMSELLI